MQLPTDDRAAAGYQPEPLNLAGLAGADGVCRVTSSMVPSGRRWLIDYMVTTVETTALFPAFQAFVDDDQQLANLLDGTTQGAAAVADYPRPRQITAGQTLVAVWTGCNPGDACNLRVEYRTAQD